MNITKSFLAAFIVAGTAMGAWADKTPDVAFTYNPDASVSEIYASIEKTAREVCRSQSGTILGVATKTRMERKCVDDLVAAAINKLVLESVENTDVVNLDAYFEGYPTPEIVPTSFASLQ